MLNTLQGEAFELRAAGVADLPAIFCGERDYIRCWEPAFEAAWQADLDRHLSRWVEHFERFTIATVAGQFAGYVLWLHEEGRAVLGTLNVSPAYRRRGIGQALFEAYVSAARAAGFEGLALSVKAANPARLMYERAGFACVGTDSHGYLQYERRTSP